MLSVVRSLVAVSAVAAAVTICVEAEGAELIFQSCGVDFTDADAGSVKAPYPDSCAFVCLGLGSWRSTWTNYQGGTCWCKQMYDHGIVGNPGAISAYAEVEDPNYPSNQFRCMRPTIPYKTDYDIPGYDIGSARGRNIDECGNLCGNTKACWAVVWTDYNGGTCWFKSRGNTMAPRAGAQACFMSRRLTTNYGQCKPL